MSTRDRSYALWFLVAAALHGGVLFGLGSILKSSVEYAVAAGESVELALVESAGEPAVEEPPQPEIEPTPPTPEPPPEPIAEPPPPTPEPEMIEPQPEPATPPPPVRRLPAPPRQKATARARSAQEGNPANGAPSGAHVQARPNYLRNPPPPYPAASKQAGEQGLVMLSVTVSAQGEADSVRLRRSSGFPRLDDAALHAVGRWRFSPARIGTLPVSSEVEVPVRFQLK